MTDVDENAAPVFGSSAYSFSIAEDAAVSAAVGTVSATDADNDTLAYTITAGNGDGKFSYQAAAAAPSPWRRVWTTRPHRRTR